MTEPGGPQAQADATRAIAEVAHDTMMTDGPHDWAICSVVLRTNDPGDTAVTGWIAVAWDESGASSALRIRADNADTINRFRAATSTAPASWVSALLQFDRSGLSRVQYEHSDNSRWWRDGAEDMNDFIERLKPHFD